MLSAHLALAFLAFAPACDRAEAEGRLRAMHAAVIARHLDGDVAAWMAMEAETLIVGDRGVVRVEGPEREAERRAFLGSVAFDHYRDMIAPVVRVSDDCTLGWVLVQVEGAGHAEAAAGARQAFRFQSAWIELYENRDGAWRAIGNVSNFAPDS